MIVGSAEIRITPNSTGFGSDLQHQVSSTLGAVGQTASRAISDAFKLTGTATIIGGAGIAASLVGFAGFEQNLNLLKATAHATDAEMVAVSKTAVQLGADLTLPATSAADAARAMTALARGGLSAVDAMNAAKGSLQLAAAAGVDVAESSLIVAKNLNAFHLAGTDATKVVDILTNAYTKSGVPLSEFANGLSNVSAVANLNGISLRDTATAMAILTKSGVDASSAGTELRAVLLRLAAPTGPAAEEIKKLGLNIFNSKGQMLPFRDVIDLLAKSTKNLSQEQQDQAFKQIFGNRAIGEALILAQGGVVGFDKMSEAIGKSGSAADIAGARMKGLSGTLEGIKSQIETVGISFGQVLAPAAQGLLNILSTQSARLTDFSSAVAAALTPTVITRYTDILTDGLHRIGSAFDGIEGPAIGAATAIGTIFASQIPIIGSVVPQISLVSGVLFGVIAQSDDARSSLGHLATTLFSLGREAAPVVLDALRELQDGAGAAFSAIFDGGTKAAQIIGPVLIGAVRDLAGPLSNLIENAGKLAGAVLPELASAAGIAGNAIRTVLVPGITLVSNGLGVLADNSKVVVPLLASIAAVKFVGFASEFLKGLDIVKRYSAALSVAQASNNAWAASMNLLPAAASKLDAVGTAATSAFSTINVAFLGIGVVVAGATALLLDNAAKARANTKAINDFRDAILTAGNAVVGTTNRVQDLVSGNDALQKTLTDAHSNAEELGAALVGTADDFLTYRNRLLEAKIAGLDLSDAIKGQLRDALEESGGNTDKFARAANQLGLQLGGGGRASLITQIVVTAKGLDTLNEQQQKGADKATLEKRALEGQTKAHNDAAKAADDQRRALDDLVNATLASIDSNIRDSRNRTESNRAVQDAAKAYSFYLDVLKDPNHSALDAQSAQRSVEDANNRVSDSLRAVGAGAIEAAQNQAVQEGKSKDSVNALDVYTGAIKDAAQANKDLAPAAAGVIKQFEETAKKAKPAGAAVGTGITQGIAAGIGAGTGADIAAMFDLVAQLNDPDIVARAKAAAAAVGQGAAAGVAAGIGLGTPSAVAAMQSLADAVIAASKQQLIIRSPSKKAADEIGMPLAQGVAVGILAAIPESVAAGQSVINAVVKGMVQTKGQIQDELKSIGDQIQAKVAEIRGTSQALATEARVNAGVAAAIPFPELIALEVAKRVAAAKAASGQSDIEKLIADQVNAQLAPQGIDASGNKIQDLFWIIVNGQQQLFQGSEAQAIAKAKDLGGLETRVIQGVNAPGDAETRQREASDAASKALADAATAAAHQNQQLFNHQLISATQYLADLRDQLGKLTPLTDDYFTVLDEITAVNRTITDAAEQATRDQNSSLDAVLHREQLMYEHQMLAADVFLADLQGRMAQVTQYSDQWFQILDEIKKVQTEQAAKVVGKTFLVQIDNNGQTLSEERLAELLARTSRITPDHFASV